MKKLLIILNILPLNTRVLPNGTIVKVYKNGNIKIFKKLSRIKKNKK